jgi:hypothetical protein
LQGGELKVAKTKKLTGPGSRENFLRYWAQHPNYTAFVHTILGLGLGLLAQTFLADGYVNMAGWMLVFIGVVGHMYPLVS